MCQPAYGVASLAHDRPATVFSMRRSITAVASVVVAFAAVGCSGSGGGSSLASTTTTPVVTTAPAATTTEAPSTTAVPAPTTTTTAALITDATTADPKALAAQLQAVFDRYQVLYQASRTNPERPFTDETLIDNFHQVAEQAELASLVEVWQGFRNDGSAVRSGPTPEAGGLLTAQSSVEAEHVGMTFCFYDDAVTYNFATGDVLDDSVVVSHGVIAFAHTGEGWKISTFDTADSTELAPGAPNPCPGERTP